MTSEIESMMGKCGRTKCQLQWFSYDANGNMTIGNDRTIGYNEANKVTQISHTSTAQGIGADVVKFAYGADGNRVVQSAGTIAAESTDFTEAARTVYVGLGDTGKSIYERTKKSPTGGTTTTEHVHFIYAGGAHGGNAFALRVVTETKAAEGQTSNFDLPVMKYNHFDHLGSVTAMSDESGRMVGLAQGGANATAFAYDAWGARRNADGSGVDNPASLPLQVGHREYTGHETIPSVGLVNMNGRVYDPELGRFLSPDPNVQFVANLQSYNRYTYAANNPLRYTDPTGYFLGISTSTLTHIGLFALGIAACLDPATCVAYQAGMAIYGAVSMYESGASFGQIIAVTALSIGISAMTGDPTNANGAWQIVGGTFAAGISSAMSTAIMGGSGLGSSFLNGMAWSAASAAASLSISYAVAVSQRSAAEQQGGGGSSTYVPGRRVAGYSATVETVDSVLADAGYGATPTEQDDLDLLNLATRRQVASTAVDLANNQGARWDTDRFYNALAPEGSPKCNLYVRDALNEAGANTPKFSANEWGNPNSRIPNWSVVGDGSVQPGDVVGFSRPGGQPGHVGIVPEGAEGLRPDVLAATHGGVAPTQIFWRHDPTVWRWTGD